MIERPSCGLTGSKVAFCLLSVINIKTIVNCVNQVLSTVPLLDDQ